jgi:hypothetical protein
VEELTSPSGPETVAAIAKKSKRTVFVPIRRQFVQQARDGRRVGGPLSEFVRRHDATGLSTFLLLRLAASAAPWDVSLHSAVWIRALQLGQPRYASSSMTKVWKRLESMRLVERSRRGRITSITVLREDGSGQPYTHPGQAHEPYFKIPIEFWLHADAYFLSLSVAEMAVLLIGVNAGSRFQLPSERASAWYGISSDSLQRGLRGLEARGLIRSQAERRVAPLSPTGWTLDYTYELLPPFASPARANVGREIGP